MCVCVCVCVWRRLAGDEQPGRKGDHCGQYSEYDRPGNGEGAVYGRAGTAAGDMGVTVNALAHDDGVVHHDTQYHEKGERGHHIH